MAPKMGPFSGPKFGPQTLKPNSRASHPEAQFWGRNTGPFWGPRALPGSSPDAGGDLQGWCEVCGPSRRGSGVWLPPLSRGLACAVSRTTWRAVTPACTGSPRDYWTPLDRARIGRAGGRAAA